MKKNKMKFSGIIRHMILEQGRYEILKKTYTEPKKKGDKVKPARMSLDNLNSLVLADPTTRRDGDQIKKAGTYTPWLVKQFLRLEPESEYGTPDFKNEMSRLQELFFEDLYKTTESLQKFDRFKGQLDQELRDINKLNIEKLADITVDFSLEKTKASKSEKEEAAQTYEHPGGEVIFKGSKWTVVKIEDTGDLGHDAACFYGGYGLDIGKGESSWCTSAPGRSNYFKTYIKNGPLYVVIPNKPESFRDGGATTGEKSGLPANRYQFHFPSEQFMGANDRQINLIDFLNKNEELKEVFKPEFMKGLTNKEGTSISVEYPRDAASKFISLYGFDEFFETLPDNLERFDFVKGNSRYGGDSKEEVSLNIPKTISRFKNLNALHLEGIVSELPKEIGELKDLVFLSLPNNNNLTSLPKEVGNLRNLQVVNLKNSPNVKIPDEIENNKDLHIFR